MRTILLIASTLILLSVPAYARLELSAEQLERAKAVKARLQEAETRPLEQIINNLKREGSVEGNLQILEAMAATYTDIVAEQGIESREQKVWLLSMIRLNMAYFQLGGKDKIHRDTGLNILIRKKLKQHLPPELFANKKLFQSIED